MYLSHREALVNRSLNLILRMSATRKVKKIKDIRVIETTNSLRDTQEGKGTSPCHWRSPGSLPRENSNLGVAC